jgi:hypothetical protein
MKKYMVSILMLLFSFTAVQAQQMHISGAVSQHQSYAELGYDFNENSSVQLTFANNQTSSIPSHGGIGFSYLPVIYDKLNIISGFDASMVVRDNLEFGGLVDLNVGVRINRFDILYSMSAIQSFNRESTLYNTGTTEPKVKVRLRF